VKSGRGIRQRRPENHFSHFRIACTADTGSVHCVIIYMTPLIVPHLPQCQVACSLWQIASGKIIQCLASALTS